MRDLDRRGQSLRQVGEQRRHLGAALEVMLGRELAAVGLGNDAALRDGDQGVMGVVVVAPGEVRLVGGDERNVAGVGELDQRAFGGLLVRRAVTLQLHVEAVAEQRLQHSAARRGEVMLPRDNRRIERPAGPAGQRDQVVGLTVQPRQLQMRFLVRRRFHERPRAKLHQGAVARLAGGQQHDARQRPDPAGQARIARLVAEIQRQRAADDRLDAVAGQLLGEFQRAEHVVGVGQRQRRLMVRLGEFGELGDGERALQQGIGGMHVQMHEAGIGGHVESLCEFVRGNGGDDKPPCPPGTATGPKHCPLFSTSQARPADSLQRRRSAGLFWGRRSAVMAREPGKPCFRRHPRPIGDGAADVDTRGRRA